jgi:hypothetical protein
MLALRTTIYCAELSWIYLLSLYVILGPWSTTVLILPVQKYRRDNIYRVQTPASIEQLSTWSIAVSLARRVPNVDLGGRK